MAAVVFGVWFINQVPVSSSTDSVISDCQSHSNWRECGGWPIFESNIGGLANGVGSVLGDLLTFGPTIAGFLAALYFIMRINMGGYKTPQDVWKTTLGIILIMVTITHLGWIAREFNAIIIDLSNLEDDFASGRANFETYMASLEQFRKASDQYSTSIINLPMWALKAVTYLLLFIPSLVSTIAYLSQLVILYGVPFSFFLAIFTRWQDLSTPISLIIRYAFISVIKAFTWTTLATVEVESIDVSSEHLLVDLGMNLWSQVPKLILFTLIFIVAGWILKRFVITPAFTNIFNPRSQL